MVKLLSEDVHVYINDLSIKTEIFFIIRPIEGTYKQ